MAGSKAGHDDEVSGSMKAEVEALANEIQQSLALLRRHL